MTRRLTAPAAARVPLHSGVSHRGMPLGAFPGGLRAALAVSALVLLAGCSFFSHSTTWTKDGANEEQSGSDLAQCQEQADVATERDQNIDQDIAAANSGSNAGISTAPIENMQSYHSDRRYKSILSDCMARLGYHTVE
jgi:hypothetical protein